MTELDRQLFIKLLKLDPVHQDLARTVVEEYDKLLEMCDIACTVPSPQMKVMFCFLWSDEEPRDLIAETPKPEAIKEGDRVFAVFEDKKQGRVAKIGVVMSVAGLSEKGKIRVKLNADDKKYRELDECEVHLIP